MARPLRIEYPGALYHITSRGNRQEQIFYDDADRLRFLEILGKAVTRYNWILYAYCLMDNHYHLLVETPDANLSMGMRQLNGVYTQFSNRRHNRFGHIFLGRFKSILVEKESYLLELCRYIVLNPVRAKVCELPEQWRWSSYPATASGKRYVDFLSSDWILKQFAKQKKRARELYVEFVNEGSGSERSPWEKLKGQIALGGDSFVKEQQTRFYPGGVTSEIPKQQRFPGRPPLSKVISASVRTNKEKRNEVILKAHLEYGYTLKNIADLLDIHYTTVSKVISKTEKR